MVRIGFGSTLIAVGVLALIAEATVPRDPTLPAGSSMFTFLLLGLPGLLLVIYGAKAVRVQNWSDNYPPGSTRIPPR